MRIGKVVFCLTASAVCALGSIAYMSDAIRELQRDKAWDTAIQEELSSQGNTDEVSKGEHISDSE